MFVGHYAVAFAASERDRPEDLRTEWITLKYFPAQDQSG
jgi:hypothetical protein